jgi:anti-sigma regulatory factor (Ser/Thr protein kinase)
MTENATAQRQTNGGTRTVFRFPAAADAPGRARAAAESTLQDGYPDLVETSLLLISELVTNCVRHGELSPDKQIELKITTYSDGLKIDIVDPGVGFRYKPREGSLDRAGGWGLYMVEQLSSRWGVGDGYPTTVWFELQRPNGSAAYR